MYSALTECGRTELVLVSLQQFPAKLFISSHRVCRMSGLAVILKNLGYKPKGSDINESAFTAKLREEGIPLTIGHRAENVEDADLVVYSAANKPGNPEYDRAKQLGLPMMERSVLLGEISRQFETVIGIAGCHGKTTITSMCR